MATIDKPPRTSEPDDGLFDEEGFPWLENGEQMSQKEFHERYSKMPEGFKAELIGGTVYIMASPLKLRHARGDFSLIGWLFVYSAATPGTVGQSNATTILGDRSEPQPDSALLVLPSHGGQSRDGDDEFTHGAPELVVEVAWSSRSLDLNAKLRDYERAGVREYLVRDLRNQAIHWFELRAGRLEPLPPGPDGIFRSRVFPGLWLDQTALIAGNNAAVVATLQRGLASPEHDAFVAELERRRAARAQQAG
jgi:Uma2 family endonuclease